MNIVGLKILEWHKEIERDLPWKKTDDPYFIWLSEIILQQTRVQQGLPYYLKFVEQYPTVHILADAAETDVFKTWEGLGYYSRARNLHATAKYISRELNGKFPDNYDELLKLKGVGPYTAAAIASFAFDEDRAVLDGNVFRVLSRIYDIEIDILSGEGKKIFTELANSTMILGKSGLYNQAIMDFGALLCVPSSPNCMFCPLQEHCASFSNGTVSERPVKKKAKAKKTRYLHFLVSTGFDKSYSSSLIIERRSSNDIWKGLHQFPLIELEDADTPSAESWERKLNLKLERLEISSEVHKQVLSHQNIRAYFHLAQVEEPSKLAQVTDSPVMYVGRLQNSNYIYTSVEEISNYSFPKIIRSFIEATF